MTDGFFAPLKESTVANQRRAIRYTSSRNRATVTFKSLFRPRKHINIEVINLSSKGARVSSKYKFPMRAKIIFNLKIEDSNTFKVPAKVIRLYSNTEYGIAFDSVQHDLIDQIMENEDDFTIA